MRWHCPPDTGFEIRRARYLSVTETPHNTDFHTWMGKKHFCFFLTAETGNRTPNSGVKGSGANHYPRAPALYLNNLIKNNKDHIQQKHFIFWVIFWSHNQAILCTMSTRTELELYKVNAFFWRSPTWSWTGRMDPACDPRRGGWKTCKFTSYKVYNYAAIWFMI